MYELNQAETKVRKVRSESLQKYEQFMRKYWHICNLADYAYLDRRSQHYSNLAEQNVQLLKDIFGHDFVIKAERGLISPEESRFANNVLADTLYSKSIAQKLRSNEIEPLNALYFENAKTFMKGKQETAEAIKKSGVALLVVRPEVYQIYELFEAFLERLGFEIVSSTDKVINFEQYWTLYHHGLIHPDSWEDFPTRTLSYVAKPCRAVLFKDTLNRYTDIHISDGFMRDFKGERGVYSVNRLRSDLVLKEMLSVVSGHNPCIQEVMLALDPIHAYRHIVSGAIPSDGMHTTFQYPFLFYVGAGIHVPDSSEVVRDLCVLYSLSELDNL